MMQTRFLTAQTLTMQIQTTMAQAIVMKRTTVLTPITQIPMVMW